MVSIIVPMYNSEKYILRCLDSISSQIYFDLQVIVVDDGSTDGSGAVADRYAEKDRRFRVIHQKNQGLVAARKQGIKQAKGEYVLFVDSDDWLSENAVEMLLKLAIDNGADVVASGAVKAYLLEDSNEEFPEKTNAECWCYVKAGNIAEPGVYQGKRLDELKRKLFCIEDYCSLALLPFLWNKLWKRELIERFVLEADESINVGEDVAIGFSAILAAECVVVTNSEYYYYRQNGSSMMRGTVDELAEYENVGRLRRYLEKRLNLLGVYDQLKYGIDRYIDNQLFTRAYGIMNMNKRCEGLYPFCDEMPSKLVIYGAGEFGRSVYRYASRKMKIKAWIDRNAELLKKMGEPVMSIDEYEPAQDDVVVVAVMRKKSIEAIERALTNKGVDPQCILKLGINDFR